MQRGAGRVRAVSLRPSQGHTHTSPPLAVAAHPPLTLSPSALTAAVRVALLGAGPGLQGATPRAYRTPGESRAPLHFRKGPALTAWTRDGRGHSAAREGDKDPELGWSQVGTGRPPAPAARPGGSSARPVLPSTPALAGHPCGPRGGSLFMPMLSLLQSHLGHSKGRSKETELEILNF